MTAYEQIQQMLASRSDAVLGLEDVLVTAQLFERDSRPPDYKTENEALTALAQELATAPENLLQKLCLIALNLCRAHSAGVSIAEEIDGQQVFRWRALAGELTPYLQSILPRDFAPCGVTVERDAVQLFAHPELYYPYVQAIEPAVSEVLLIPFRVAGNPVGTVWIVSSTDTPRFDREDARLLTNLSLFATAGYQTLQSREELQSANIQLAAEVTLHRVARDQRDASEQEAARRTRLFDTVLSSIVDFTYTFDREGRFTYINQALLDLWHKTPAEALGKTFLELDYPSDLANRLQQQIETVFTTGRLLRDETPYTNATGDVGYYEYIFVPVFGPDGQVDVVAGSTREISARHRIEAQLRETKNRLEVTLNAGEIGTWTWNIPNDQVVADKNLARFFSVSAEDAQGGPIAYYIDAIHPDDREQVATTIQTALQERQSYEAEYRLVGSDGLIRHVIARGRPEYDAAGNPLALHGVALDITERKAHEVEIHALNRRLTRAMKETHHRVKNNLQVISAMIDMQVMEHQGEATIPLEEFTRLKTHIHTLAIVHDLLTLSIKEDEDIQRLSVLAVLENLLPLLQSTTWNQHIDYSVEDVILTSKQCIAVSLTLNELVSNGLKHGKTEVQVNLAVEGPNVILIVGDDGAGFPAGFDPRTAANTGLELVGSLVRMDLQGVVTYGNKPEGGGLATVVFPLPPGEE